MCSSYLFIIIVFSLFTGDSGYPLEPYLLTPLLHPRTHQEISYNSRHTKTRVTVERCFGILKSRFRCLHKSGGSLQYVPEKCAKITAACLYLHNLCVKQRLPLPEEMLLEDVEVYDFQPERRGATHARERGRAVRQEIINLF